MRGNMGRGHGPAAPAASSAGSRRRGIGLVMLAGAASVAALVAVSGVPASSQEPPGRTTIKLFTKNEVGFEKFINEGGEQFGAGDWAVNKTPAFDPDTCERVGAIGTRFVAVQFQAKKDAVFGLVDGGIVLPEGTLTLYDVGDQSEATGDLAITGGTGAFKDARGEANVTETRLCDKAGVLITADITTQ